ncbi:hypothetical protein VB715_00180 [Crocosphaera sp. UHCC 0190]|uniref:hypothetical protein n=1 Tax=Crocosphaera sp. UHCC 0190 TaxID=3110246 RepID=UPI002B1EB705|nr:hypothetical protein [Crocosphaera sp. UHCC 0190]MEA5508170.1 hypothetical protein [Crocosphaera sp. UHCC 0190]
MVYTIVNLTSVLVIREVEDFLAEYPLDHPYQVFFSRSYFRHKLIAHILCKIPNRHIVVEDVENLPNNSNYLRFSLEERLKIENLIAKEIPYILNGDSTIRCREFVTPKAPINQGFVWEENYN